MCFVSTTPVILLYLYASGPGELTENLTREDIHSCAMVFLLGYLCSPKPTKIIEDASLLVGYDRCLAFLRSYESQSRSAKRCSKILDFVKQEVFNARSGMCPIS